MTIDISLWLQNSKINKYRQIILWLNWEKLPIDQVAEMFPSKRRTPSVWAEIQIGMSTEIIVVVIDS